MDFFPKIPVQKNNNNREEGIPQILENTSSIMHKLCIVMC